MKKFTSTLLSASVALALLSSLSMAKGSDAHWGYTGHDGPESWGNLSPKYKMCRKAVAVEKEECRPAIGKRTDHFDAFS